MSSAARRGGSAPGRRRRARRASTSATPGPAGGTRRRRSTCALPASSPSGPARTGWCRRPRTGSRRGEPASRHRAARGAVPVPLAGAGSRARGCGLGAGLGGGGGGAGRRPCCDRSRAAARSGPRGRRRARPPTRLRAVALAAEDLLTSDLVGYVAACPGVGCGWLFADRRRRRRWCSMAACGNRAKARRYAQRHGVRRLSLPPGSARHGVPAICMTLRSTTIPQRGEGSAFDRHGVRPNC